MSFVLHVCFSNACPVSFVIILNLESFNLEVFTEEQGDQHPNQILCVSHISETDDSAKTGHQDKFLRRTILVILVFGKN